MQHLWHMALFRIEILKVFALTEFAGN